VKPRIYRRGGVWHYVPVPPTGPYALAGPLRNLAASGWCRRRNARESHAERLRTLHLRAVA
jgi:hypothetical protein